MRRITGPIRFVGSILKDRAHIRAFFNRPDEAHRVLLACRDDSAGNRPTRVKIRQIHHPGDRDSAVWL